jgi:hypothetical protein
MGRAFSPCEVGGWKAWGVAPGWFEAASLALSFEHPRPVQLELAADRGVGGVAAGPLGFHGRLDRAAVVGDGFHDPIEVLAVPAGVFLLVGARSGRLCRR